MALTRLVPSPEERHEAKLEGRALAVDKVRTFDALNRARSLVFGRADAPDWLETAWEVDTFVGPVGHTYDCRGEGLRRERETMEGAEWVGFVTTRKGETLADSLTFFFSLPSLGCE